MLTRIAALSIGGLFVVGGAFAAAGPQEQQQTATNPSTPAGTVTPSSASLTKLNTNSDGSLKVVVHTDHRADDGRDSRVDLGDGVRVSSPDRVIVVHGEAGKDKVVVLPPLRPDGLIRIPDNTLGPGEAMWQIRERETAALKIIQADAALARADAERARPYYNDYTSPRDIYAENASFGRFGFGGGGWSGPILGGGAFGGFGGGGGGGRFHDGLRGPVVTTVTRPDQLGATAQGAFSDAAYPRLNGSQDARDRAVRQFGRDATPPIARVQDDVDRANNNANREHPAPPPPR